MKTWKAATINREMKRLAEGLQKADNAILGEVQVRKISCKSDLIIDSNVITGNKTLTTKYDNYERVTIEVPALYKPECLAEITFLFKSNTVAIKFANGDVYKKTITSLKYAVDYCINLFNSAFDEFEANFGESYNYFLPVKEEPEEVAEETAEQPKAEDSKVKAVAQYLESKITGWYENARVDYCVKGKFISCKAEGENGIRINWEEDGKEYTMVINWFTEYSAEQLYNIWMAQDVEVEEVKKQPKEEQQVTVVENPKLFVKDLAQSLNEAGFATSYKKSYLGYQGAYNIHAMADKGVMVDIDFDAGICDKLSTSAVVYDLADCSVIDGGKYNTEADYIKAIVEKVISSSNREQKIVEGNKLFESTDTTDDKVRKLQKEFKQWEVLQEREKEADEAYEANYTDKELEKAADEAYAAEYKQYDKIARMIAELINIDVLTAKGMLMKTPKQVKKILGL